MKRLLVLTLLSCSCGGVDRFVSFDQKDGASSGGLVSTFTGGRSSMGGVQSSKADATSWGSGGAPSTGGATPTGGTTGSGGATADSAGGASSDGMSGTGGTAVCTIVMHYNGIGQTWLDCVPRGAHNEEQAMKACVSRTGDARKCATHGGCDDISAREVVGYSADAADAYLIVWGFLGSPAGYVSTGSECPISHNLSWD